MCIKEINRIQEAREIVRTSQWNVDPRGFQLGGERIMVEPLWAWMRMIEEAPMYMLTVEKLLLGFKFLYLPVRNWSTHFSAPSTSG